MGYSEEDTKPRRLPQTLYHQGPNKPRPTMHVQKPKPKNWAALLQSQSPSMDLKLDFYPHLFRGKEAQVEIDIELTDVGR